MVMIVDDYVVGFFVVVLMVVSLVVRFFGGVRLSVFSVCWCRIVLCVIVGLMLRFFSVLVIFFILVV